MKIKTIPILLLSLTLITTFQSLKAQTKLSVIYETDFSADWDDISAIALLHAFADIGEVEILGCMINTSNEFAGRACDAVNTFYGRPDIPIGVYKGSDDIQSKSRYTEGLAREFPNDLPDNNGVMEADMLYRKILASQPDKSVTILSVGFNDNLAALLKTQADEYSPFTGLELVKAKVKILYIMGPYLEPYRFKADADNYRKGFNFHFHHESAKYVVDNWPTEIKFAEGSFGHNMFIGNELHQKTSNNPIRRAFELSEKTEDWNQHCADPSTIIYGVWDNDFFNEVADGSCSVRAKDGWTKWVQSPDLEHSYNLPKASIYELEYLMDALLLKDPLPDIESKIIHPSPKTVLYPGKKIPAKGLGKNLQWTIKKRSQKGLVIISGDGVNFDFTVPKDFRHGEKLILTLQGDGGSVSSTYTVKTQGLLGKYYHRDFFKDYDTYSVDRRNCNWLSGSPHTLDHIDSRIDFNWGNSSPDLLIKNDSSYSIVWTGYIKSEYSETYTLYAKSSSGVRLYIDNALLIDDWAKDPIQEKYTILRLEANRYYPIRIEYIEETGESEIRISWSSKSQKREIIPERYLYVTLPSKD